MKIVINFLTVVLGIGFLVGCGGSGNGSNDVKCTNSNPTYPSLQSVFPTVLFGESYQLEGKFLGYTPIDNTANYVQLLVGNGYTLDQNEPEYATYILTNPFSGIQFSEIAIDSDGYVDWHLGGATSDIDDSLFNNTTIFPPTGTQQDVYSLDRIYASDMTNEFNSYITELENNDYTYEDHWEGWVKNSDDGCFVYIWSKDDDNRSADWEIDLRI
ncbi:MAG: hypothetical protein LBL65_00850 [Campylobacteraceae bacterium]|jgi:hypothetical protein|nr:hypothetical protein [Campylobacteraceae bacterium]